MTVLIGSGCLWGFLPVSGAGGSRFLGPLAGCPSTRWDRLPGGVDVACGVHIGVGFVSAGPALEDRWALAVLSCGVSAGSATLGCVGRVDRHHQHGAGRGGGFLLDPGAQHPDAAFWIERFRPRLAATLVPGSAAVPFAERTLLRTWSSSTPMWSWSWSRSWTRAVDVFSTRSRRRSVWRAFKRAITVLVRFHPVDPFCRRAFLRSRRQSRCASPELCGTGMSKWSPAPVVTMWVTPRSGPTAAPVSWRANTGRRARAGETSLNEAGSRHAAACPGRPRRALTTFVDRLSTAVDLVRAFG